MLYQPASPGGATCQLFPVSNVGSVGFNRIVFKNISDKLVLMGYRLYLPNPNRSTIAFNLKKGLKETFYHFTKYSMSVPSNKFGEER